MLALVKASQGRVLTELGEYRETLTARHRVGYVRLNITRLMSSADFAVSVRVLLVRRRCGGRALRINPRSDHAVGMVSVRVIGGRLRW